MASTDLRKQRVTADTRLRTRSLGNMRVREAAEMGAFSVESMVVGVQTAVDRGAMRWVGLSLLDVLGEEPSEPETAAVLEMKRRTLAALRKKRRSPKK